MKKQLFLWLVLCTLGMSCDSTPSFKRSPKVILIMADDLGFETLGCNGNIKNKTPNLDRIASKGISFNNCISTPICTPSRVKIMTGKYNYRNFSHPAHLSSSEHTIGNIFEESGYATCIAGKWQLNGLGSNIPPEDKKDTSRPYQFGFQEYCLWHLTKDRQDGERYGNPLIEQDGKILSTDKSDYGPDIFSDFILNFIERKKAEPFFIYYPMVLVHDPFEETPDSSSDNNSQPKSDSEYFKDMVEYTDKIIGKIVAKITELGLSDNTIIIFTGDNGTPREVYSHLETGIIKGGKGTTTNAGTHVPLIAYWGNKIETPFEYNGLVEFSDFYATFAELTNQTLPSDGQSFLNVIKENQEAPTRKTAFMHFDRNWSHKIDGVPILQFARTIRFKLYKDGRFYDLQEDAVEKNNLSERKLSDQEKTLKLC